jgi:hypothetical protein
MSAKEQLLRQAPSWSEHDAEVALRAVEREHGGEVVEEWGDLDAWSDAAMRGAMRELDEVEATEDFSWNRYR